MPSVPPHEGSLVATRAAGAPSLVAAFALPSRVHEVATARRRIVAAVARLGLPRRRVEDLELAVGEVVANAVEHGATSAPVEVRVHAAAARVTVEVAEPGAGPGRRDTDMPDPDAVARGTRPPRGWGRPLVRRLVDDVTHRRDGQRHVTALSVRRSGLAETGSPPEGCDAQRT